MVRRTFGQVKDALARTAGQTGMPVDDDLLKGYVNEAIQELMNEGDWPGVVDRWKFRFNQATALVSLPSFLERLIDVTVDDYPLEIRSPWYEFVQYGPGIQREADLDRSGRRSWVNVVMDRGETPLQFPLPDDNAGPWTFCLTPSVPEADPIVNLAGFDSDGNVLRTQITDGTSAGDWINGENLTLSDGTSQVCTSEPLSSLTAVVKPLTNGPLTLTADDGTNPPLTVAVYQFDEINPSYRHYFIPHLYRANTTDYTPRVILARCRRRFVPIQSDDDTLIIGNVLALQEMMIAQWARTVPDQSQYQTHKLTAIDIMRKESAAYMGKSRTPSLTFSRGYGIGSSLQYLR